MTKTLLLLFILFLSCKKEEITERHPEFAGAWRHYISAHEVHYLSIGDDARGGMTWHKNGKFVSDTQPRKWFIKHDYLIFGRLTGINNEESYKINAFPAVATYSFITDYDTVGVGQNYMILDNQFFVDK